MLKGRKLDWKRKGFSLLELLAVLAVILILAGLTLPSMSGIQRWLAIGETEALFHEIEHACRIHRMENGHWPAGLSAGEVALNDTDGRWRDPVSRNMETPWPDEGLADGFGHADIYILVDVDGDHWILPGEFEALQPMDRPSQLWSRVAIYSLDAMGRLAVSNW
jgi:prepilin-type N-terminal cleavage/methylation domain-containing protein